MAMKTITVSKNESNIVKAGLTQIEALRSVRRNLHLPTRQERPLKGAGYRRPQNNKDWNEN